MKYTPRTQKGFTLVELMIAVVILAILVSLGWSLFESQARTGYRTEAIDALSRIAQLQERWHSRNGTYHGDVIALYGTNTTAFVDYDAATGTGRAGTGRYNLQINLIDADTYTATATHIAMADPNDEDQDCFTFTINQAGAREAFDKANNAATRNCWSQ